MTKVNKLQAESLKLSGFRVKRTKHGYFLLGDDVKFVKGYLNFL